MKLMYDDWTIQELEAYNHLKDLGIPIEQWRASYPSNSTFVAYSVFQFPPNSSNLVGTRYYYDECGKLLHFTSFENCVSIMKEKTLRMYNLHKSSDK